MFFYNQSGFLSGHSTVYQLIELYHGIVSALDSGNECCMVFCDLSKAFDRVWHRGLLYKLNSNGIDGRLLNWFQDYLFDRSQIVVYKDISSSLQLLKAGVPQGWDCVHYYF